ncbi:Protein of unknown function [Gryllus bimaculatus]|nr:Protein of unknown function [Gryllus bimaculatus]
MAARSAPSEAVPAGGRRSVGFRVTPGASGPRSRRCPRSSLARTARRSSSAPSTSRCTTAGTRASGRFAARRATNASRHTLVHTDERPFTLQPQLDAQDPLAHPHGRAAVRGAPALAQRGEVLLRRALLGQHWVKAHGPGPRVARRRNTKRLGIVCTLCRSSRQTTALPRFAARVTCVSNDVIFACPNCDETARLFAEVSVLAHAPQPSPI